MIEVSGLTKTYGSVCALQDVTFNVDKGKIVGFLGANGAGKTTTMDIVCGCIGSDQGSVRIGGIDILEDPIEAKRRIGYLPDEPPIYDDMRVSEYIDYAARLNKVPSQDVRKRVDETLERLSLGEVKNRLVGNLSKGFRQRVGLAQAIVHNPDVLVLDEPTEGLDPNQIVHIRELIQQLGGQHTIMLSSHILSEVQNTCDEIIIINKGRIIQQGTHQELLSSLEKDQQYVLTIAQRGHELASQLAAIPYVSNVEFNPNKASELGFVLKGTEDQLDQVAKLVIDGGYGLRGLTSKGKSLEEIFFELTH
jgi:ABC-2 type transport system ATP-binding protein